MEKDEVVLEGARQLAYYAELLAASGMHKLSHLERLPAGAAASLSR